ncbi:MAG TPA: GLPGLI family protein [Candidatus Egerieousia sp.]|nr:GLPGLI family protein [Candidatus Egerieousia sp.]HPT06057.1 GLPGLI family protein [Candidatus Egerieousia sp.]
MDKFRKIFTAFLIAIIAATMLECSTANAQTVFSINKSGISSSTIGTSKKNLKKIDSTTFEVTYKMYWLKNPDASEGRSITFHDKADFEDLLLLQVGKNVSKCFSYKTFQKDSLIDVTPVDQVMANTEKFTGGATFNIYQNYPAGKLTYTSNIMTDFFLYTEPEPEIEWTLQPEKKDVIGYSCSRATCTFRGRNYEAWYTNEIPASLGPWKFRGLPGLILSIKDDSGIISFEATGLRKCSHTITYKDAKYIKTNREKFNQQEMKFEKAPIDYMSTNSNVKITINNPDGSPSDMSQFRNLKFNQLELK